MLRNAMLAMLLCCPLLVQADDLDAIGTLDQSQFDLLNEDLTALVSYKGLQPAEPYGIVGFDVGVEFSSVTIANESIWGLASGDSTSNLALARLSVNKGLPLGFDVGAFLAKAPSTNVDIVGAQLRYALVEGGIATPAVGLRVSTTRLEGVDELALNTRSLDLSISKGFGPFTPYAGVGRVWGDASPAASTGLVDSEAGLTRQYVGARFSLLALQLAVEADKVGDSESYSLKFSFGF
ncbi:MAG: hypothetical protein R3217_02605 [Gammaproteobacteria bacterium]|nr:hypothetical protein [Gammaproteobacteria bacterium]